MGYDHLSIVAERTAPLTPEFLYHVTRASNLASIRERGLDASRHGEVHGAMEVRPPRPAVYLSRKPASDNLHANLFDGSPLVVLTISAETLDTKEMWPDDFIYDRVAEGDLLGTAGSVRKALGCDLETARDILSAIESATDENLPVVLQPFWSWYLRHREGGEVAYTADIPPSAIVSVQDYAPRGAKAARAKVVPFREDDQAPLPPRGP